MKAVFIISLSVLWCLSCGKEATRNASPLHQSEPQEDCPYGGEYESLDLIETDKITKTSLAATLSNNMVVSGLPIKCHTAIYLNNNGVPIKFVPFESFKQGSTICKANKYIELDDKNNIIRCTLESEYVSNFGINCLRDYDINISIEKGFLECMLSKPFTVDKITVEPNQFISYSNGLKLYTTKVFSSQYFNAGFSHIFIDKNYEWYRVKSSEYLKWNNICFKGEVELRRRMEKGLVFPFEVRVMEKLIIGEVNFDSGTIFYFDDSGKLIDIYCDSECQFRDETFVQTGIPSRIYHEILTTVQKLSC